MIISKGVSLIMSKHFEILLILGLKILSSLFYTRPTQKNKLTEHAIVISHKCIIVS